MSKIQDLDDILPLIKSDEEEKDKIIVSIICLNFTN